MTNGISMVDMAAILALVAVAVVAAILLIVATRRVLAEEYGAPRLFRMMDRMGLRRTTEDEFGTERLARAVRTCVTCSSRGLCDAWMEDHADGAPPFCPNRVWLAQQRRERKDAEPPSPHRPALAS